MAMTFDELREYFVENLLNATKIPADKLNELVDELLTTCEFNLDELTETFKGSASTSTNPGTPAGRVWYITEGPGTYTNFLDSESDPIEVTELFGMLIYNGSEWELVEHEISVNMSDYAKKVMDDVLDANENKITNLADAEDDGDALSLGKANSEYIEVGKNLFDKTAVTTGKYVNETNGTLTTHASYQATDYIPVEADSSYWRSNNANTRHAWYTSAKVFVSGANNATRPQVAPATAAYIRYTLPIAENLDIQQFEKGTYATAYEPYGLKFKTSKTNYKLPNDLNANSNKVINLADAEDDGDALSLGKANSEYIEVGKNLFDKDAITEGYYVDNTTGGLLVQSTSNSSDYIPVIAGNVYNLNITGNTRHAFYTAEKVYISGGYSSLKNKTIPENAAYIRFSYAFASYDTDILQFEKGAVETNYNAYIQRFQNEKIEVYETNFPDGFPNAAYKFRDNIKHTVIIDAAGNGDYTTIADAYAAITDCSFENQYEFIIYPGNYNEQDLTPPPFSHTYAQYPNSVYIYYDNGLVSVFEIRQSCKLSNLKIAKLGANPNYCIHYDSDGDYDVRVFTNLTLIRTGGTTSIIGGGSWKNYEPIFINCKYISDAAAPSMHSQINGENLKTHLRHVNESLGDKTFAVNNVGGKGLLTAEFTNCAGTKGINSVYTNVSENPPRTVTNWWEYPANNCEWIFTGGGNKDFVIKPNAPYGQALLFTAHNYTDTMTISGTAVDCLFGPYKTTKGGDRIYPKIKGYWDVRDVQNAGTTDVIQMWKRLGDCSSVNKTLTITINGAPQTYTFTANYLTAQTAEGTIISAINAAITNATLSKIDGGDNFDNIMMAEKSIILCEDANSILRYEFLMISGTNIIKATTNAAKYLIVGIAVNEAVLGELLEIWSGPLFMDNYANGEYGVGSDGKLDITQSNKIGYVLNEFFYPYY